LNVHDSSPAVLLHHDGELSDVRSLLESLGAEFEERIGDPGKGDEVGHWDVIVASPRRLLHARAGSMVTRPTLIAVLEGDSRTLRSHLRRMRVDLMVKRPVHPAALRLLILHTLYRGPEKRRKQRVSVGAEIRIRAGLFARAATLTDLSVRGCQLLTRRSLRNGRPVRLRVPAQVTGGKPLRVKGTVVRTRAAPGCPPSTKSVAVRFEGLTPRLRSALQEIIERHQSGPATIEAKAVQPTPRGPSAPEREAPPIEAAPRPAATKPEIPAAMPEPAGPAETSDRRRADRHSYDRRVVALSEEATRVLLGRDISRSGMRVDPNESLSLGDVLQIALHTTDRAEPLVIRARVQRDDGPGGLVLRFESADGPMGERIHALVDHLPLLSGGGEEDEGVVISEILEQRAS
jgi:hypothetical protein